MAAEQLKLYSLSEMKDKYIGKESSVNRKWYENKLSMELVKRNTKPKF